MGFDNPSSGPGNADKQNDIMAMFANTGAAPNNAPSAAGFNAGSGGFGGQAQAASGFGTMSNMGGGGMQSGGMPMMGGGMQPAMGGFNNSSSF